MRLSIRWRERGAAFLTASFIIICLAGGSESGQTEQAPSISPRLSLSLVPSYLLSFSSFATYWMDYTFISFSFLAPNLGLCPVRIRFDLLVMCSVVVCLCLRHLSETDFLHLLPGVARSSLCFPFHCYCSICHFSFHFHINLLCSGLFLLFCPVLFIQYASPSLLWCLPLSISALQFASSVFHLSPHHLTVTLDVFHFSSFYSNLSLHSLHWCYFSLDRFWSLDLLSPHICDFWRKILFLHIWVILHLI